MRDYVVYHRSESWQVPAHKDPHLEVVSRRIPAVGLIGSRVWLLVGSRRPRQYHLFMAFEASKVIRRSAQKYRNGILGQRGKWFDPPIRVDGMPWFQSLRRSAGNFAFGLTEVRDPLVQAGLTTYWR